MTKKSICLDRIREGHKRLVEVRGAYAVLRDKQDIVLLHFLDRADQIVQAALLIDSLATPLQILCRVLCEDFFLACWIAQSQTAVEEYEAGVAAEVAKMMSASLRNGWGVIRNRQTKQAVTREFMQNEFLPKLKALKTPRAKIEQIAQKLGLARVYDILYRSASLDLHGNTFGVLDGSSDGGDYRALSSIDAVLACLLVLVELPRKPYDPKVILALMRL